MIRNISIKIVLLLLFLAPQVFAVVNKSFDEQRPEQISDAEWFSLKTAVQETKLLPLPTGIGGLKSKFARSVAIDGQRAIIGSSDAAANGAAYIFEYDGFNWLETHVLQASDGADSDQFGHAVSISGNRVVVGAYLDDNNGSDSGSAYVFDLVNGQWIETKLTASDASAVDNFGFSVSLSGDRVIVGAYRDGDNGVNSGSAYVFDLVAGNWIETKLTAIDGLANDQFGYALSLSGNRALIGAFGDDDNGSNSGSAYIFDLILGSWQQTKLTASDAAASDRFGYSLSLSGDRALIGAYRNDDNGTNSGSAYIFDLVAENWIETKILASDALSADNFSYSVSLSGNRAVVGAYRVDFNGIDSGSTYIFEYNATLDLWQETKLNASDGMTNDQFGYSVAISANRVLIGAYLDDDNNEDSGSAYVYEYIAGNWQETKVTATEGAAFDAFGYSVSLLGDRAIVGAYLDDTNGTDSGVAYIFDLINGNWISKQLLASDGEAYDFFGYSVSLSEDRAIVGAYLDDDRGTDSGSAYIFDLIADNWIETKLIANDGASNDAFGYSVSIFGDRALIGAYLDNDNGTDSGSVYIYDLILGAWQETKLIASDGEPIDYFGYSTSLWNDKALVGAYLDNDNGTDSGSVYVYDLILGVWQETKLIASDGEPFDYFGYSISLWDDKAIVGAYRDDDNGNNSGSAYIFEYALDTWFETKLTASDGADFDNFGNSVSLFENRVLVGANLNNENGINSGAVYIFQQIEGNWFETKILTSDGASNDQFGNSVSLSGNRALLAAHLDDDNGTSSGSSYVFMVPPTFTIGGFVSGLQTGNNLLLQNNNSDDLLINIDGAFVFANTLTDLQPYDITIKTQPNNQLCLIENAFGMVPGANVNNVLITCEFVSDLIFKDGFEF